MPQDIVENNTQAPTASGLPDYFHIVPIERTSHVNSSGETILDWKGPNHYGWQQEETAQQYNSVIYDGWNGGICHKQSGTMAFDIDDYDRTAKLLREEGINLAELITRGVQIHSGRQNRAKLLYRLPQHTIVLGDFPRTFQFKENQAMVYELRCVSSKGLTMQDVLPPSLHPKTKKPYQWVGDPHNIPVIPPELLALWERMQHARCEKNGAHTGTPDTAEERRKVTEALARFSPECTWDEWIGVGFALHSTTWADAFNLWLDWSATGSKFLNASAYAMEHDWDGWDYAGGVNIGKLYRLAIDYSGTASWMSPPAINLFTAVDQPATIDNDTQQVVTEDWTIIVSRADPEMDANVVEQWVDYIVSTATNRADSMDKLKDVAAISNRYTITELKPMLTAARRRRMAAHNAGGEVIAWLHANPEGDRPLTTIENFHILLHHYQIRVRYNQMTKSLELEIPNTEFHSDTEKNSQIIRMESFMIQHGMNSKQAIGYCNLTAQDEQYHPFREYLDAAGTWDGVDRIPMLADTLKVAEDKVVLRDTLLRRWLVSACAAALRDTTLDAGDSSESDPSPRGVFTLQGEQYMGKTRWFRNITPKTMFKEGLQLGNDKDTVKQATNCLIVEIGEADVSTKQDAGRVKAFISRDYDELRVPWDKAESRWPRRTVFGGSVNPAKFLTDTTGNSRWWVVPVLDIDFMMMSFIDIKQLWLQIEQLWLRGEPYLLTDEEMAMLNISNKASQEVTHFAEWLSDCWDLEANSDIDVNWLTSSQVKVLAKTDGIPLPNRDTCAIDLEEYFGHSFQHGPQRRRVYKMPARRVQDVNVV